MNAIAIASTIFACVFGAALLGMFLHTVTPERNRTASKDLVSVVTSLVGMLSALVLGLLTASAKTSFGTVNEELRQVAADVLLLDRALAQYGPETRDVRHLVRSALAARIKATFPQDKSSVVRVESFRGPAAVEAIEQKLLALSPKTAAQHRLKSRALKAASEVERTRWLWFEQAQYSKMPTPFLVVLTCWLSAMFVGFGLSAPRNAIAIAALCVGALSVSTSVLLIEELDSPLTGWITVSSAPLESALANVDK